MMRVVQPLAAARPSDPLGSLIGGIMGGVKFGSGQEQAKAQTALLGKQAAEKDALAQLHASQQQQQEAMLPFQQQLSQAQAEQAQQRAGQAHTQSMFTPEVKAAQEMAMAQKKHDYDMQLQQMRNQADRKIADMKAQADSPEKKGQIASLRKNMDTLNDKSQGARNNIFLQHKLLDAVNAIPGWGGPGPWTQGNLLQTTPEGQYFLGLLSKSQAELFKGAKNVRNLREFMTIVRGGGTKEMTKTALDKLFKGAIEDSKRVLSKQHFYNHAINSGVTNPDKIAEEWGTHEELMEKKARESRQQLQPQREKKAKIQGSAYSLADLLAEKQRRTQLQPGGL